MLVPGEYLIKPVAAPPASPNSVSSPTPLSTPAAPLDLGRTAQAARHNTPAPRVDEPEPQSFLLTLLRALGAIHT